MLDFPDSHDPKPICNSIQGKYKNAAVVSNTEFCSSIGRWVLFNYFVSWVSDEYMYLIYHIVRDILKKGGSAVDATIGTLLCEGLCAMQNMGIGGGCFMTIYNRQNMHVTCLDAREAAPMSATPNMYNGCYFKSASGTLYININFV